MSNPSPGPIPTASKSDLVADLRAAAPYQSANALMLAAADEIERLTAELEGYDERYTPEIVRLRAERDEWKAAAQEACDENNALRAERDRLRGELDLVRSERDGHLTVCTRLHEEERRLRAALREMHALVHGGVYRSGSPFKNIPDARTIAPHVLKGINEIMRRVLGRDDESLKYFRFPDDAALAGAADETSNSQQRPDISDGKA